MFGIKCKQCNNFLEFDPIGDRWFCQVHGEDKKISGDTDFKAIAYLVGINARKKSELPED